MNIFRIILIVVEIISCLLLIGVILLQQSKSQGMGVAFGGGMSETLFGSRAGNILTKITITLAIIFLANTTLLGIMYTSGGGESSLVEKAPVPAPQPNPGAAGPIPGGEFIPPAGGSRGTLVTDFEESAPESIDEAVAAEPVVAEPVMTTPISDSEIESEEIPAEPVSP